MIVREAGTGSGTKKLPTVTNPLSGTAGSPSSTILDKGAQLNGITKTINNAPTSNTNNVSPTVTPSGGGGGASGGSGSSGMVSSTPAQSTGVNSYNDLINAMFAAQREKELSALENEYNAAIGELEREKAAIAPMYQGARNQAAGVNAREMQAMNEMFTAAGLSSGGRAQGAIAQSNVLQGELSALELAEAQALAEIESQRTQLATQYQGRVREAIMNNEMDKAAALYEEAIRYDNAMVDAAKEKAKMLASIGDYSGYAALGYTPEQIAAFEEAAKPKYSGGGVKVKDAAPTLTFEQAIKRAEYGDLSTPVLNTLYAYNYTDADLEAAYGYKPASTPTISVGYDEFVADLASAKKAGDSSADLNNLIAAAKANGIITNQEAVQLRGAYVGGR